MSGKKLANVAWGPWIAMAAAVILTAKGEFDLAVDAHFSPWIAWMFPVMLDVYVVTSFHRRRWKDMVVGMFLMIFCQVAVHLLPVFITEGEEVPWGLVVAVACIAPIVVVRVKILTGRTAKEIEAAQEAARGVEEVRAARAETVAARRAQAEAEAAARAETARAEAETVARVEAETRAVEAETRAAAEAETRAEIEAATEAEIADHVRAVAEAREAAGAAEQRATAAVEAARLAEGRLAEARDTADRAVAAHALAGHAAAERIQALVDAAEQAERDYRQALAEARSIVMTHEDRAGILDNQVQALRAQLDEAQRFAERQAVARAMAEQESQAIKDARDGLVNELERTRRALARVQEKAETGAARQPEILRPANRKSLASVPAELPADLPEVETVKPETVAAVLAARGQHPEMTNKQLSEITGISDRTIRKVLNAVPAEIVGQVLELTSGSRVA
ncbi:hypothetical protein [Micromonospora carbonacea]|uniref:DUF2637 domain-containing protein n=1 Tax=Micromonospora carbonacea TaxID=47853 RepID=A0A1C5AXT5_9ACTN|nr:hypothetical protein [Micromonospora carbonacea]SCF50022.1 hypothetical protein GA0070563_1266 [Micromonospora carbonacea]